MQTIIIPAYAQQIIENLNDAGYEAYLVGGCVRDGIRGTPGKDYDITTSALPAQIKEVFEKTYDTGILYGTVTVAIGEHRAEVTTFRKDLAYLDYRRPEEVEFSPDLYEDLKRRDFTVNAMAYHKKLGLIDPFDGLSDIRRRVIRCVGNPSSRFKEDALRMLRAVRFCSQLGFTLEENTKGAILENSHLAAHLSAERVYSEMKGVLRSPRPECASLLVSFGLLDQYLMKPGAAVQEPYHIKIPAEGGEFFSVLLSFLWYLSEQGAIFSTGDMLKRLKADNKTKTTIEASFSSLKEGHITTRAQLKKKMYVYGAEHVKIGLLAAQYRFGSQEELLCKLEEIIKTLEPYQPSHLAISPGELQKMGFRGREIKMQIEKLLSLCWENPKNNDYSILLRELKKADNQ